MINFGSLQGKGCNAAGAWLLDLVGVGNGDFIKRLRKKTDSLLKQGVGHFGSCILTLSGLQQAFPRPDQRVDHKRISGVLGKLGVGAKFSGDQFA